MGIRFSYAPPSGDRRHVVSEDDVRVVLSRLPSALWARLEGVYFKDGHRGRRLLGYVTRGRRDITLCALPPRISLASYLRRSQSPRRFGALRGCQWPHLAIRRFMLYDVLLHELGHMQELAPRARSERRRFAHETASQDFAEAWCARLWSQPYDHADPVHNPPTASELAMLDEHWRDAHDSYKRGLQHEVRGETAAAFLNYQRAVERYPQHALALEALGILSFETIQSASRALGFLQRALHCDPALYEANVFAALAWARLGEQPRAREHFDRALRLSFEDPGAMALYARVLGEWGNHDEARRFFDQARRKRSACPFVEHNYKMFLRMSGAGPQSGAGTGTLTFENDDWRVIRERFGRCTRGLTVHFRVSRIPATPPRIVR